MQVHIEAILVARSLDYTFRAHAPKTRGLMSVVSPSHFSNDMKLPLSTTASVPSRAVSPSQPLLPPFSAQFGGYFLGRAKRFGDETAILSLSFYFDLSQLRRRRYQVAFRGSHKATIGPMSTFTLNFSPPAACPEFRVRDIVILFLYAIICVSFTTGKADCLW